MDARAMEVIRTVLDVVVFDTEEPLPVVMLELERLGDEAFDIIQDELKSGRLTPKQQINALRSLSHLTRQQCFPREEELFDQILRHTTSDSRAVRSVAVHMAIWSTFILERFPQRATREENRPGAKPSLRERVQRVVKKALERGLDPKEAELAQRFLKNLPPDPDP
jgi:hypothetical protein